MSSIQRSLCALGFALCCHIASAQQVIQLYNGKPAGSETWTHAEKEMFSPIFNTQVVYNVVQPTLTVFAPPPSVSTGTAVVIAPGGGFQTLSINSEGIDVAKWLVAKGVTCFVLKYRLVESKTDNPVMELMTKLGGDRKKFDESVAPVIALATTDGLTAMKYVRDHAKDYEIDPNRIGFMGFSAGGMVTMSVIANATGADNRPNFIAPIYGRAPLDMAAKMPKEPTPAFVVVASDDQLGLTSGSVDIYNQWFTAKQPAELHIYAKGGHGFGMRKQNLPSDTWIDRFGDWLKTQGFLKKLRPTAFELAYSEAQRDTFLKRRDEQLRTDWAQLNKYADDDLKLPPVAVGEKRVVFLGNSITENWVKLDSAFFAQGKYVGRGISGQTTPQTLVRFRQDVLNVNPSVLVLLLGTNDIAQNTGPMTFEQSIANIASMVELAQAHKIKVIIGSVLPARQFAWRMEIEQVADKIVQFNVLLKAYAAKSGCQYVDFHTALKDDRNGMPLDLAADGVHPTLAGYKVMEPLISRAIADAMK